MSLARRVVLSVVTVMLAGRSISAQEPPPSSPSDRHLVDSDMTRMNGMTSRDPMGGMEMSGWMWMTMGAVRLVYNHQGGPSGDQAVESSNWVMVMGQRQVGRGLFTLMSMSSLEPATLRGNGSPELFQTGESKAGRPLVDYQHPHDFFMNLSATYRHGIGQDGAAWIQVAPRGEPALGPTAFMHRASTGENPAAPLGHHWEDSTHIADDVLTLGGAWGRATLEGSVFHGREPDEHRWNIDGGKPDSASGRLKLDLGRGWSAQVSYGFLKEPEPLEPGNTHRTTASLHYGAEGDRPLAATLLYGRNRENHGPSSAVLLEGAWQVTGDDHLFARFEAVQKDAQLLASKGFPLGGGEAGFDTVRALTLGYLRGIRLSGGVLLGAGADLTAYDYRDRLRDAYGDHPVSVHVFARVRWGKPHGHGHMHHGA